MQRTLLLILALTSILGACKKDEEQKYTFETKLGGLYYRDSSVLSDGYKILNLKEDGNYCWTRVISGKDSNFCYGTYIQTSDTSLLWDNQTVINFKATKIDSIPNGILLQLFGSPPLPALYGFSK